MTEVAPGDIVLGVRSARRRNYGSEMRAAVGRGVRGSQCEVVYLLGGAVSG